MVQITIAVVDDHSSFCALLREVLDGALVAPLPSRSSSGRRMLPSLTVPVRCTGRKKRRTRMKLRDQKTYCLPDGTYIRAVHRGEGGADSAWELHHLNTDVLQYTMGPDGRLTGYAIWEQMSGEQTFDAFPTDITVDDLQLA
jgi:hypothetical protein